MEFTVENGQGEGWRYIAVYPIGMRGFSIVISHHAGPGTEPEMLLRQVQGEEALLRLLVTEGIPEKEIRDCFRAEPPRTRTIVTASALSGLVWLLIGSAAMLFTDWF